MSRARFTAEQREILISLAQGGHVERFHISNDVRCRVMYELCTVLDRKADTRPENVLMDDGVFVSPKAVNGLWRRELIDCMTYGELQWVFRGTDRTLEVALAILTDTERVTAWAPAKRVSRAEAVAWF